MPSCQDISIGLNLLLGALTLTSVPYVLFDHLSHFFLLSQILTPMSLAVQNPRVGIPYYLASVDGAFVWVVPDALWMPRSAERCSQQAVTLERK